MKTRQKIYLMILMAVCTVLLSGCHPYFSMEISEIDAPPMTEIYVLLRAEGEQLKEKRDVPEELLGSEIALYNEDGWVPAAFAVNEVYESHWSDGWGLSLVYKDSELEDNLCDFCETFRELRLAVVEKDGRVRSVSQPYSLIPEDRFAYPIKIYYDEKEDSITATEYISRHINGSTPSEMWAGLTMMTWITNIAVQCMISRSLKHKEKKLSTGVRCWIVIMLIPGAVSLISGLILNLLPYFNTGEHTSMGNIKFILFDEISFFISVALLLLLPLLRKSGLFAAKEKTES